MNPAIVVVAYNRPLSVTRLLNSLSKAKYLVDNITLVISIDFENSDKHREVVKVVNDFEWKHGQKQIIQYEKNIGLKNHIISCGDLTEVYGSIILLEDDLVVSPMFYQYAYKCSIYYMDNDNISGISLYAYEFEELGWFRFYPLNNGTENYFMQWASSWGQMWTKRQWDGFKQWYTEGIELNKINIPDRVKGWNNSWKKFFIAYLVQNNKYFVFPYISYTSLIDESGTHLKSDSRTNQVSLVWSEETKSNNLVFSDFENALNKYDSFFQPIDQKIMSIELGGWVSVGFDLYGTKKIKNIDSDYVITIKNTKNNIRGYSNKMIPYELNVFNDEKGMFFQMTNKSSIIENSSYIYWGKQLYGIRKIYSIKEMLNVVASRIFFKYLNI